MAIHPTFSRFFNNYGMLGVLVLLCLYFSWATFRLQSPIGEEAASQLAGQLLATADGETNVILVAGTHTDDTAFTKKLVEQLSGSSLKIVAQVNGSPREIGHTIRETIAEGTRIDIIASSAGGRLITQNLKKQLPELSETRIELPDGYYWSTFLKTDNILAVANRVGVIAIIAVGMTMVIITGGIDLSVGSVLALSAVVTAWLIRGLQHGYGYGFDGLLGTSPLGMTCCCLLAIALAAGIGGFSGVMTTVFRVPPFIATLAIMLIARGLALKITKSESISGLPSSFEWLGLKADLFGIPNAVVLMVLIYLGAHAVMSKSRLGRHIYAVGGNREAARLSGIRVKSVLITVYVICGAMAGLGGVIEASQFTGGDPTSGKMYELDVIAAVVVGGTSLSGGEGRIFGTLIGAFIIAVIQNGMNLTAVQVDSQRIVLGFVILGAVLLDMFKKQGWRGLAMAE